LVTLQRSGADVIHACLMAVVEHHMETHSESERRQASHASAQTEDGEQRGWTMERSRCPMISGGGATVEPHGRRWASATLLKTERKVVIGIDQHRSGPQQQRVPPQPPAREDRGRRRDRNVIADPHHSSPDAP
jgi:hypothetical protein